MHNRRRRSSSDTVHTIHAGGRRWRGWQQHDGRCQGMQCFVMQDASTSERGVSHICFDTGTAVPMLCAHCVRGHPPRMPAGVAARRRRRRALLPTPPGPHVFCRCWWGPGGRPGCGGPWPVLQDTRSVGAASLWRCVLMLSRPAPTRPHQHCNLPLLLLLNGYCCCCCC